jgi:hypothetical protein
MSPYFLKFPVISGERWASDKSKNKVSEIFRQFLYKGIPDLPSNSSWDTGKDLPYMNGLLECYTVEI